jgi:hypothetical protein
MKRRGLMSAQVLSQEKMEKKGETSASFIKAITDKGRAS